MSATEKVAQLAREGVVAATPAINLLARNAATTASTIRDRLQHVPQTRAVTKTRKEVDDALRVYAAAEAELGRQTGLLGQGIAEVLRHAEADRSQRHDRLSAYAQQVATASSGLPFLAVASFDDPRWMTFEIPTEPSALLGRDGLLLRWGAPSSDVPDGVDWLPFAAEPLVGGGASWIIETDETGAEDARLLMQALAIRLAFQFPRRARFTFIDPIRSGLSFPMGHLMDVRPSGDLTQDLAAIDADIKRIARTVVHRHGSFEYVPAEQQTAEKYEFIFAADFPCHRDYSPYAVPKLLEIGRSGPPAGRYVILHRILGHDLPREINLEDMQARTLSLATGRPDRPPPPETWERLLNDLKKAPQVSRAKPLAQVLRPPETWWTGSAATCLETSLDGQPNGLEVFFGQRAGGEVSYHGAVAAATGMGKSNLLHAIILGLATTYSPDELQLYLLDLKQGVEFNAYVTLPHAAVIGSNTDPALARAVVDGVTAEVARRYDLIKELGIENFAEYRRRGEPSGHLARIVLVIDEYQNLFLDAGESRDDVAGLVSADLVRISKEARAAGVHLLLGSQTFRAAALRGYGDLFQNIGTLMGLRMPPQTIDTLGEFESEGRRLLKDCDVPGKVVLNTQSGRDRANRLGQVVKVDRREELLPTIERLAAMGRQRSAAEKADWPRLQVFDGNDPPPPDQNLLLAWKSSTGRPLDTTGLAELAALPVRHGGLGLETWVQELAIPISVGRDFSIYGQAVVMLRRRHAQNLLAVASSVRLRHMLLTGVAESLGALDRAVTGEIVALDGSRDPEVAALLQRAGIATAPDVAATLTAAAPGIVILIEPDRFEELLRPSDPLARKPPPLDALEQRLRDGARSGRHTIVVASSSAGLGQVLAARRAGEFFDWKLAGQMSLEDSQELLGNRRASELRQTGAPVALLADRAANRFTTFMPFAARTRRVAG